MRRMMIAVMSAMALGCSSSGNDVQGAPGATTSSAHAAASVKPGSHEDWCGEHEIPESQCTKCNKDLIPAFKATGDWCTEHGLPESQCTICDPKRKKDRPAKGS